MQVVLGFWHRANISVVLRSGAILFYVSLKENYNTFSQLRFDFASSLSFAVIVWPF
jgi:hypothetical protein